MKKYAGVSLLVLGLLVACGGGDEEEDGGPISCSYEQRSTGCSGTGFGDWEDRCLTVDDPREGLTPSEWCDIATGDTTECAGGCCKEYEFRSQDGFYGSC
jgi:hypothetical protein